MSDLPLFYRNVVPLNRDSHRALRLAEPARFGFARDAHLIPAVTDEFAAACRHLPILFLPEGRVPTPVFITGFRPGRSMLIDEAGAWTGRYLPAYLRRYPFILGEVADADPLVCLDEAADGLATAETEAGLPLFGADGSDTPALAERIALTRDYADAARRTAAFGQILQDLGLLRPVTIQGRDPDTGDTHTLHGAQGVDERALAELPDADLLRLRREGWLAAIYAHLVSLQAIADFNLTYSNNQTAG
ncbi:SapC family protein [Methylobacterium sp. WL120]|uniref:SapC family protein n=1 Tax=Methylobacterium sp. WL120 TaxID=2603887 RepID=UPI0011CA5597|nr:SapC family protein [Methylobacterium sp. WL120]TXM64973.1 SapC family protein [Methylobacterium sp. WL120]